jgi:hypothetical protein
MARVISARKKGRLRCHKRPKSREETPNEGSDSIGLGGQPLSRRLSKMVAISGSIERRETSGIQRRHGPDTKVYDARPNRTEDTKARQRLGPGV